MERFENAITSSQLHFSSEARQLGFLGLCEKAFFLIQCRGGSLTPRWSSFFFLKNLVKPDNLVLFHLPILPDSYDHADTSLCGQDRLLIYYRIGLLLKKAHVTKFLMLYLLSC